MKISDLNKIKFEDIRNIDWELAKDRLLNNPTLIICIAAGIITAATISYAYRSYKNVAFIQKTEVSALLKKAKALDNFETVQKQYAEFIANISEKISENEMIELLSNIALTRDVQIMSFSPTRRKSNAYINVTTVEITIASESYIDTLQFMRDIEKTPHAIRIGRWSGVLKMPSSTPQRSSRGSRRQISSKEIKNEYVQAEIRIETVEFKNE